jgi:hypothetical protein
VKGLMKELMDGAKKRTGGNLTQRYDNCMELAHGSQFYQCADGWRRRFFLTRTSAETILAAGD